MSELRQNPCTKEWVIIATERAKRPEEFSGGMGPDNQPRPAFMAECPFCPGNENETPPEILAFRNRKDEWILRVVPNKFAALSPEGEAVREEESDFFRSMNGFGKHEVIIESRLHNASFGQISDNAALRIIDAYYQRFQDLSADRRFKLIKIFRNCGSTAGTSLEHPHSQIVATPVVPLHIRHRLESAMRYYDDHGDCVFCTMIEKEKEEKERLIIDEPGFIAFTPFAARVPFETWIIPERHMSTFGEISKTEQKSLARIINRIMEKINRGLDSPAYNMIVRTAPSGEDNEEYYHWHIQIIPRLTTPAGFELGTGVYINTSLPEETSRFLREI
ncbi:MAG: galactose-1-phosphate uridylyltransferase [Candidatus Krumholzibacteriota bacterium]|nr:galactose-1-phosphate uridylyltransferase [Candidatus Krumholzibacteriota bacterium]